MTNDKALLELQAVATRLAEERNADVILLNSPIEDSVCRKFVTFVKSQSRRPNAILILSTHGGDPHAAYMMARSLQRTYKDITAFIVGDCYSAGSLIVLGANRLVIGDMGHLGPLDIQIRKKDELGESLSGMIGSMALDELEKRAMETFANFMVELKVGSQGSITLRTAMDVATELTTGLYGELYKQIDPQNIGRDARAMKIMEHYGELLSRKPDNVLPNTLRQLLERYPDHACIIDRDEAMGLFVRVDEPTGHFLTLNDRLSGATTVTDEDDIIMLRLSDAHSENEGSQNDDETNQGILHERADGRSASATDPGDAATTADTGLERGNGAPTSAGKSRKG